MEKIVNASEELVTRLKLKEDLRLEAYLDQAGVWTIGYGTTKGVQRGDTCTPEQAEAWIRRDVAIAEKIVLRAVRVPLKQHQFDALVMFTYNTGTMGQRLKQALNAWNLPEVFEAWREWKFITDKKTGRKVVSAGLVNRRAHEIRIFQHGL